MNWKERLFEAITNRKTIKVTGKEERPTGKTEQPTSFRNRDPRRGGRGRNVAHSAGSFEDLKQRSQVDTAARIARVHGDKPGPRMQRRIRKHDPDGTKYGLS